MTSLGIGKNVEKELSFAPNGAINLSDILENRLAISAKAKRTHVTGPSKNTHTCIPATHTYVVTAALEQPPTGNSSKVHN